MVLKSIFNSKYVCFSIILASFAAKSAFAERFKPVGEGKAEQGKGTGAPKAPEVKRTEDNLRGVTLPPSARGAGTGESSRNHRFLKSAAAKGEANAKDAEMRAELEAQRIEALRRDAVLNAGTKTTLSAAAKELEAAGFTAKQATEFLSGLANSTVAPPLTASFDSLPASQQNYIKLLILGQAQINAASGIPASTITFNAFKIDAQRVFEVSQPVNGPDGKPVDVAGRILQIAGDHIRSVDTNGDGKLSVTELDAHNKTLAAAGMTYQLASPVSHVTAGLALGLADQVRAGHITKEQADEIIRNCG